MQAIAVLFVLGLAAGAAAQGARSGKASSETSEKLQPSEIRAVVHEAQKHVETLRGLLDEYRSLVEGRPKQRGSGAEAKKAYDKQVAKWGAALDGVLRRLEKAHARLVQLTPSLGKAAKLQLTTALGRDVADTFNEAEAQRTAAEQALSKSKDEAARLAKNRKQTAEKKEKPAENHELDDLDDL